MSTIYVAPPAVTTYQLRFPSNLSLGARGGPGFATRIAGSSAGFETRRGMWDASLGHYTVGHNLRTPSQWATLIGFHRLATGQLSIFRFQDWTDYTVISGQGVLTTSPGGLTVLAKTYSVTDLFNVVSTVTRIITRPQPGTVSFNDGSSVIYNTGVVTGGAIGTTTWTGQFDVPCRFSSDEIDMAREQITASGWRGIEIEEVRIEI